MTRTRRLNFFFLPVALFLFASCDNNLVFEKNLPIAEAGWNYKDTVVLDVPIKNPGGSYNFYVNIRNSGDYKYSNIFLFTEIHKPSGEIEQDTLECFLADAQGKWLGKGTGAVLFNQILFRQSELLNDTGTYSFRFQQGMRDSLLENVLDVGVRVERAE